MRNMPEHAVVDGIRYLYNSTDYEFVAYLLSQNVDPSVELVDLIPLNPGEKHKRFTFVIGPVAGDEPTGEWHEQLRSLHMDYINGRARAEPRSLAMVRRDLRGLVVNYTPGQKPNLRAVNAVTVR